MRFHVLWLSSVLYLFLSNEAGLRMSLKGSGCMRPPMQKQPLVNRNLLSAGNTKSKARKQSKHIICFRVTTRVYTTSYEILIACNKAFRWSYEIQIIILRNRIFSRDHYLPFLSYSVFKLVIIYFNVMFFGLSLP